MKVRKRQEQESAPVGEPEPEEDCWDSPGFRNHILWNLLFVAAPALVMALLRVYWAAALWFGAGVLLVVWDAWPQVRDFWRWLRGRPKP